jgi:RNA polymerase sigma-70 factor (ECF subfamily)
MSAPNPRPRAANRGSLDGSGRLAGSDGVEVSEASVHRLAAAPTDAPSRGRGVIALDLEEVYRVHHGLVWRSLRGLGVPEHAVDDAVQDVFVVVHRRRHAYDGRASLRKWVLGIARNVALKYRERTARHVARVDPVEDEPPATGAPGLDEAMAERQAAVMVDRFLDTLDPDKRAVFVLADVEGLSAPEIADVLGVKLNTVYSRLRVARQKFEQAVARHRSERPRWNP